MTRLALLSAAALVAVPVAAQDHAAHHGSQAVQDSVMMPIKRLFDGMRAHDSTMIRSAFIEGAVMMSQVPRADRPQRVQWSSVDAFVAQAGQPGEPWDEQLYDPVITVDGGLAQVWVFYTFSAGTRFSHCGYDGITVVRTTAGWKISAIADTRRTTECDTAGKRKV
jgi:hypothetical protein